MATDMTAGVKEKYDKLLSEGLVSQKRWGNSDDVGLAVESILCGGAIFHRRCHQHRWRPPSSQTLTPPTNNLNRLEPSNIRALERPRTLLLTRQNENRGNLPRIR